MFVIPNTKSYQFRPNHIIAIAEEREGHGASL